MFVFQLVNNCFVNWKSKGPHSALLQKKTKLLQNLFRCLYYLGDLLSFKFFSSVYKILNTSGCLNHFSIKNIYCFFLPTSPVQGNASKTGAVRMIPNLVLLPCSVPTEHSGTHQTLLVVSGLLYCWYQTVLANLHTKKTGELTHFNRLPKWTDST